MEQVASIIERCHVAVRFTFYYSLYIIMMAESTQTIQPIAGILKRGAVQMDCMKAFSPSMFLSGILTYTYQTLSQRIGFNAWGDFCMTSWSAVHFTLDASFSSTTTDVEFAII